MHYTISDKHNAIERLCFNLKLLEGKPKLVSRSSKSAQKTNSLCGVPVIVIDYRTFTCKTNCSK